MSIRQKMLFALGTSLFLAFAILGMALTAVILKKTHSLAEETRSFYAMMGRNLIAAHKLDKQPGGEKIFSALMPRSGLVTGWLLVDQEDRLLAHGFRDLAGRKLSHPGLEAGIEVTAELLRKLGVNTMPAVVMSSPKRTWTLRVASPEWAYLPADAWVIVLSLFIGMLIIMGVAFGVTESLIISPMASLAAASRLLQSGALPPPIPATSRRDEVGELVRSFQAMAGEVMDYRHNMEQKVEEETARRLQAERSLILAQRLSATSRLAAGIAHEINNPLAGIMNAARALESGELSQEKQKTYLDLINDGLTRIDEIVQKMLSFQRTPPSTGRVQLAEVVETALGLANPQLKAADVEKELSAATVIGDKGELVQAVLNLILNSTDAISGVKSPRICLKISVHDDHAAIAVEDNGCGMSPETLDHAFDLFYSEKEMGTGLGLAITHTIIENHGGKVSIESTVGEGVTVIVHIPLAGEKTSR